MQRLQKHVLPPSQGSSRLLLQVHVQDEVSHEVDVVEWYGFCKCCSSLSVGSSSVGCVCGALLPSFVPTTLPIGHQPVAGQSLSTVQCFDFSLHTPPHGDTLYFVPEVDDTTAAFGSHQVQGSKTRLLVVSQASAHDDVTRVVETDQVQMCKTRLHVVSLASKAQSHEVAVFDLDDDSRLQLGEFWCQQFSPSVYDLATDPAAGIANRLCWDEGPLSYESRGGPNPVVAPWQQNDAHQKHDGGPLSYESRGGPKSVVAPWQQEMLYSGAQQYSKVLVFSVAHSFVSGYLHPRLSRPQGPVLTPEPGCGYPLGQPASLLHLGLRLVLGTPQAPGEVVVRSASSAVSSTGHSSVFQTAQPRRGVRRKIDRVARHETCIWTCNVTAWTSARLLVDWLVASDLAVDCLMRQETMRVAHEVPTVKSQAAQHKMHCLVGPAVVTEAMGKSAGTILMSRWNRGLAAATLPEGLSLDSSRLQLAHWPGVIPGGIVVGTIYLHDGCKVHDEKNQTLLRQLVAALKCIKLPFVVGGDWNMAPMVLASSGIPDALSAKIVHPVTYTYHSGDAASVLDFFLVSGILAPAVVECKAYDGSPVSKHSPVRFKFSSAVFARTMTTLQKPPMYKHLNITSVANKPVCVMQHLESSPGTKQVSSFYSDWARLAEDELNSLHGVQAGVCRRGRPLKYVNVRHAGKGSQHTQADPAASCFRQVLYEVLAARFPFCYQAGLVATFTTLTLLKPLRRMPSLGWNSGGCMMPCSILILSKTTDLWHAPSPRCSSSET